MRFALGLMLFAIATPLAAQTGQTGQPESSRPAPPPAQSAAPATVQAAPAEPAPGSPGSSGATYDQQDVLGAAEREFGKGAKGLAELVEKIFKERGRPNAYIAGREAGGAFVVGLRYGGGTLYHKVEGERPVFWTGPSVGFDIGGDGSKTFALVYNLNDTDDIFRRYPQVEGKAYFVGGFTAAYLQRDDVIIVPIKLGVGWRLGANLGYWNVTRKGRILPF